MTDPLTDTIPTPLSPKAGSEALPECHRPTLADTHTPLHGPTGGVPSDKALLSHPRFSPSSCCN
eukprot:scaffold13435_cov140-Isochrysis_galbana.AAC.2